MFANNLVENDNIDMMDVLLGGLFCYFLVGFLYLYMIDRYNYNKNIEKRNKKALAAIVEDDEKMYDELIHQYSDITYKIKDMFVKYDRVYNKFGNMSIKVELMNDKLDSIIDKLDIIMND